MRRRRAIRALAGVAGAPLIVPAGDLAEMLAWGRRVRASGAGRNGAEAAAGPQVPSALTPPRARVLEAMAEVVIPTTDTPGAGEADVSGFVAALVDGWLDEADRDRFLAGLDTVDPAARDRFGMDFADCAGEEQNELVGELDAEVERLRADADGDEALHFFHDVKRFTLTAYFTSEAGLDALGHRTSYRAFEGCAPLAPHEMAPADRTPRSRRPGPPLDPLQSDEARR